MEGYFLSTGLEQNICIYNTKKENETIKKKKQSRRYSEHFDIQINHFRNNTPRSKQHEREKN